jgi:AcrR family transcriptional regulator
MTRQSKDKTRTPSQQRSMETRDKLIVAALELFSEKGFHATNSKQIAARAGVATGSFYAYFNDKKELFAEVFKYYCSLIEAKLCTDEECKDDICSEGWNQVYNEISNCDNIRDKLRVILANLMDSHENYKGFQREVAMMRLLDPELKILIDEFEKKDLANMIALVRSMQMRIRVKDPDIAAYIVYRTIEVIIHEDHMLTELSDTRERILNEMTDMIYRYLAAEDELQNDKQ